MGRGSYATRTEFLTFLNECRTLEMLDSNKPKSEVLQKGNVNKGKDKRIIVAAATSQICTFCKESHRLFDCPAFLRLSPVNRRAEIKKKQLCMNCLRSGHYARDCKSSKCRKCSKAHNTLLHKERVENVSKEMALDNTRSETIENAVVMSCIDQQQVISGFETLTSTGNSQDAISQVVLSTAQVYVKDNQGKRHTCRALLDAGSQMNFITEELAHRLQLPSRREKQAINGIMQMAANTQMAMEILIESRYSGFKAKLDCVVLPKITERIPQVRLDKNLLSIPKDKDLADTEFNKPGKIDLLIGAGLFWNLLCVGQIKMAKGHPIWQKTQLGWIIGGELINAKTEAAPTSFVVTNSSLSAQLERFWNQEERREPRRLSAQEAYCEDQFISTTSRDSDGRFIVRLPKDKTITIGTSEGYALQRFLALERRLKRQPNLKAEYIQFMSDYEKLGHMVIVDHDTISMHKLTYFIPHHPIVKPDNLTTKLRVVFDASAKTDNDRSLNDMLLPGPNLQNDLIHILLRFRMHKYVLTEDIAMMFRQILVTEDRRLQLIFWRSSEDAPIRAYALKTVTYGTTSAPYLAMRCIR